MTLYLLLQWKQTVHNKFKTFFTYEGQIFSTYQNTIKYIMYMGVIISLIFYLYSE